MNIIQNSPKRKFFTGDRLLFIFFATLIAYLVLPFPRVGCMLGSPNCYISITSMLIPLNPEGFLLAYVHTWYGLRIFSLDFYLTIAALFFSLFVIDSLFQMSRWKRVAVLFVTASIVGTPLYFYTVHSVYQQFGDYEYGGGEYIEPLVRRSLYDRIRLLEITLDNPRDFSLTEEEMREKYIDRSVPLPEGFTFPKVKGYEYDPFLFEIKGGDDCIRIDNTVGVCFGGGRPIVVFTDTMYALQAGTGYYHLLETTDFADPRACESGWWRWPDVLGEWDKKKCLETKQRVIEGTLVTKDWWKVYDQGSIYYVSEAGTTFDVPEASGYFEVIVERGGVIVWGVEVNEENQRREFKIDPSGPASDPSTMVTVTQPNTKFKIKAL